MCKDESANSFLQFFFSSDLPLFGQTTSSGHQQSQCCWLGSVSASIYVSWSSIYKWPIAVSTHFSFKQAFVCFFFFRPKCVENSTYESLPFMWNWQTSVKVASLHLTTFPNMPCVFRPELSCRYNSYQEQERIKADQMSALFAVQHIKLCSCSTTKLSNSAWFSCQDVTTTAFSVVSIAQTNGRLVTLFSKL